MKYSNMSFFKGPITNRLPCSVCSVMGLFQYITTDAYLKQSTEEVHRYLDQPSIYKQKKLYLLPFVTPGGVFSRRCTNGLLVPSGDFVIDLDQLPSAEEAVRLRDMLAQDHLLKPDLAFISPSTRGVKLFIPYRIVPDRPLLDCFQEAMQAAWMYLESVYELEPDRANSDICRACQLCHDAGAKSYHLLQM